MSPRRPNSFPAPAERAILEGRALPSPSPRYELALSIRRLNQRLGALSPEQQRAEMPSWNVSWDELTRRRSGAGSDAEELEVIRAWERHWSERIKETFEASPGTSRGITQNADKNGERGAGDKDPLTGHVASQVSRSRH